MRRRAGLRAGLAGPGSRWRSSRRSRCCRTGAGRRNRNRRGARRSDRQSRDRAQRLRRGVVRRLAGEGRGARWLEPQAEGRSVVGPRSAPARQRRQVLRSLRAGFRSRRSGDRRRSHRVGRSRDGRPGQDRLLRLPPDSRRRAAVARQRRIAGRAADAAAAGDGQRVVGLRRSRRSVRAAAARPRRTEPARHRRRHHQHGDGARHCARLGARPRQERLPAAAPRS